MTTYIAVIEVWGQCSANYDTVRATATRVFPPEATVREVMEWADKLHCLSRGDVRLTVGDDRP